MKKRFLLLMFCFCLGSTLYAQTDSTKHKGLTKTELATAKELYSKMIQSETYISMNETMAKTATSLNGLKLPQSNSPKDMESEASTTDFYRSWLAKNLNKTKFKSVDEGVKAIMKGWNLTKKLMSENKEVFALIGRANEEQGLEIVRTENPYDRLYDLSNKKH
ncbi:hypothetical protein ACLI1A_14760 [Flavobacterium sp. RHBU_3]|uniref:hypothetical protein n=1 Tax=Flavobacterium sp. RHBU_3 TaxID=3391184 RepID=UPI0039852250